MKALFVTTSFPRFEGDYAGVFVYDVARTLVKRGISVSVLAPQDSHSNRTAVLNGIQVTRFPYLFPQRFQRVAYGAGIPTNLRNSRIARVQLLPFVISFVAHLWQAVRSSDIVHAHWVEPAFLSLSWATLLNRPVILSMHRFNPQGPLGRVIYKAALEGVDYVSFNSTFTKASCERHFHIRTSSVIPPGVDLKKFEYKWDLAKRPQRKSSSRNLVFALGSLLPVKGFIHLIEAIPLILETLPCHFIIGGQGPEMERLKAHAKSLGLSEHITFLGRVSTGEVPSLMQEADVFVLPSVPHISGDNESLGMVLVEALACGTPCVASDTGGTRDVVEDNVNGFLVAPGNPAELAARIVTLLSDDALQRKMGCAGRRKVESQFALSAVADQLLDVYQKLLA